MGDCTWTTQKSTSLVVHIRKHFELYPYECKICGKSFTQSGSLKRHVDTVHMAARDLNSHGKSNIADGTPDDD